MSDPYRHSARRARVFVEQDTGFAVDLEQIQSMNSYGRNDVKSQILLQGGHVVTIKRKRNDEQLWLAILEAWQEYRS